MDLAIREKTALIAGASRGIGFATARALLTEGAWVVITGRDERSLDRAREDLTRVSPAARLLAISADMTDADSVSRTVDRTVKTFGGLDIAVANVGSGAGTRGWQASEQEWHEMLRVNLLGGMAVCRAVMPHLSASRGSLTFVASIAGQEAVEAPVAYMSAKAALLAAVKALSREAGGVRVNAVAPGNVLFAGGTWERKLLQDRERVEHFINTEVPLKRFGTADEIADAIVFLASARASFINGACLVVDGGQTRSL